MCGGAAGITSVVFTYPLDIVRTRLSIQSASFAALSQAQKDRLPGMWKTMIIMYKTEGGVLALYRGIIPTVAGVAPYVCLRSLVGQSNNKQANIPLGWFELHDLRDSTKVPHAGRRQESQCSAEACSRSNLRGCCTNMHLSFVSPTKIITKATWPHLLTISTAMFSGDASKSIPCPAWDISTSRYSML